MNKSTSHISHEFVEFIPETIESRKLYISIPYATALHKCCCGCGTDVVTPISPTDWKLIFDGETVSLDPSIGNWSFKCQSHYFIKRNKILWAGSWSNELIEANRRHDKLIKEKPLLGNLDIAPEKIEPKNDDLGKPKSLLITFLAYFRRLK